MVVIHKLSFDLLNADRPSLGKDGEAPRED